MALPTSVIDKLTQRPSRTPGWFGQLFVFSVAVFIISLIVYFGLAYGYQPFLLNSVGDLDAQIKQFAQQVSRDDQDKIIAFYSQLSNLEKILKSHTVASPVFDWLEKTTLPTISYASANLTTATRQLRMSGVARTPEDLSAQVQLYQTNPDIASTVLGSVTVNSAGSWQFSIVLTFRDAFFLTYQPIVASTASSTPSAATSTTSTPTSSIPAAASSTPTSTTP